MGYTAGPNLYQYASSDPIDLSDPTGNDSQPNQQGSSNLYGGQLYQADFSSTAAQQLLRGATAVGEGTEAVVGAGAAGATALGLGLAGAVCVAVCPSSTAGPDQDEPRVTVYRSIGTSEYNYLQATGNYGSNPNQSGKYFANTLQGAENIANNPAMNAPIITSTTLLPSVYGSGYHFNDPGGGGPSVFFSQPQLPTVYGTMTRPVVLKNPGQ